MRVDAGRGRMQAVALVELGVGGDAVEEERIEQQVVSGREVGIDGLEIASIIRAEIGRRPHAGEQHLDTPLGAGGRTISSSASRVTFGSIPRSVSLAPSSTMTASVPSGTDQSRRASPPDAVSPETPALVISTARPLALSACSSLAGKAALAGKPSPAVRESPSATIRTGRSAPGSSPGQRASERQPHHNQSEYLDQGRPTPI